MADKRLPERTFRIGAVKCAVWMQEYNGRQFRSVSLTRTYKDDRGEFQDATNFTLRDLPNALAILKMATDYVLHQEASGTLDDDPAPF